MATYLELRTLYNDSSLRQKVEVASVIAAEKILSGDDTSDPPFDQTAGMHDKRVTWAQSVFRGRGIAEDMLKLVLAANAGASVATIQGATDAAIQTNVEDLIDGLAATV